MAMVRSALGRVSRRLSGSAAAPSAMCRRGLEILQAPPLPSLRPAGAWMPRPEPPAQLMRTLASPAVAAAAAAARTRCIQGWQHFPVVSKGTQGMKCAEQNRFLCTGRKANGANLMESARLAVKRFKAWNDVPFDARHEAMVVLFVVAVQLAWITTDLLHISIPAVWGNILNHGKSKADDAD
ncbi:hypothetical protein ACP4OV_000592 [Aristida adscensionis]